MRVRRGTRVRAAVSTAARGVAGPRKGSAERGEPGGAGRRGLWGARARPLAAGRGGARTGLTARPSPGEVRAPVARACAARRPRERALSAARARSLRHPPAPAPAAAPPPPPPTFCRRRRRRRHNHLLRCPLLSSPSVDYQVSAAALKSSPLLPLCAILLPPLAPEMDLGSWASVRRKGGGLSEPSALGSREGTRARDARTRANACICECWGPHHRLRANEGGCARRVGRG